MKPDQIYQEMKDLAEKLGIIVSEQNFRKTGIHVNSGLCKIKGQSVFVMDKHESIREKTEMLAACLSQMSHEDIYIVPAVREILNQHARKKENAERG
jgi:hypothetical protein